MTLKKEMAVEEADIELAEATARDEWEAKRLAHMMRLTVAEMEARIGEMVAKDLATFTAYLSGELSLVEEPGKTFAGIVRGICEDEIVARFLRSRGTKEGGVKCL